MLVALGVAACADDSGFAARPPAQLEPEFNRHRLGNGLDVLVVPDHSSPMLTAMLTVHSGAFVEEESQSGYSHLLEHMLFKANELEPDSEVFRSELERLGVVSNAFTGRDYVAYYVAMPAEHRNDALELFSASLRSPVFEQASLDTEIAVVLAEYDRADADVDRRSERRALELLFDRYPNRVDALGKRQAIQQATPDALRELYQTYYVPNNACLILIGDVDADEGLRLAKRYFGDWTKAPNPLRERPVPQHPALTKSAHAMLDAPVQLSRIVVAFQAPSTTLEFRDAVAADLLSAVTQLPDHPFRTLVRDGISGAGLEHQPSPGKGALLLELAVAPGQEANAIKRARALGDFASQTQQRQIETARDKIWMERAFAADSSLGLAMLMTMDWSFGRLDAAPSYLDTLYELGPSDLERVWKNYLGAHPAVTVTVAKGGLATTVAGAQDRAW